MIYVDPATGMVVMGALPPVIYLDHGPMRHISVSPSLTARLLDRLRRGGTLALSSANFLEIGNQDPGASIDALRDLLTAVYTKFCFIDTSAFNYADRAAVGGADELAPAFDMQFACNYADYCGTQPGEMLTAERFVQWAGDATIEQRRDVVKTAKEGFSWLLRRAQERGRSRARLPRVRAGEPRALEYLAELYRVIALEGTDRASLNDGIDFMHASVAPAACDFVVLDSGWKELVRRVPKPLRRAEVFSAKPAELLEFLAAVELFAVDPKVK